MNTNQHKLQCPKCDSDWIAGKDRDDPIYLPIHTCEACGCWFEYDDERFDGFAPYNDKYEPILGNRTGWMSKR